MDFGFFGWMVILFLLFVVVVVVGRKLSPKFKSKVDPYVDRDNDGKPWR